MTPILTIPIPQSQTTFDPFYDIHFGHFTSGRQDDLARQQGYPFSRYRYGTIVLDNGNIRKLLGELEPDDNEKGLTLIWNYYIQQLP